MDAPPNLGSGFNVRVMASLRLLALTSFLSVLAPIHVIRGYFHPAEPFRIVILFHRQALRILGFKVRVMGSLATGGPLLFVANHASYLDIPVLASILPAAFIAKAEIEKWPFFGTMAKIQQTLFVERKARHTLKQTGKIQARLAAGQNLILFPEGTSSDGLGILPFKSALFGSLESVTNTPNIKVQPISITCTGVDSLPMTRTLRPYYSWFGDMTLVGHFWNMLKFGRFNVDVIFHTPVSPSAFSDRKALTQYCEREVAAGVQKCLSGRFVPNSSDAEKAKAATNLVSGSQQEQKA